MRIRTRADNKQLGEDEVQIEDLQGAISVTASRSGNPADGVKVCTVRGIPSRKAQFAVLSAEGVDKLIEELERVKAETWPST